MTTSIYDAIEDQIAYLKRRHPSKAVQAFMLEGVIHWQRETAAGHFTHAWFGVKQHYNVGNTDLVELNFGLCNSRPGDQEPLWTVVPYQSSSHWRWTSDEEWRMRGFIADKILKQYNL